MDSAAIDIKSLFESHCCLCVGAGATSSFVGSWQSLLGKLLGRRLISKWLSDGRPYGDVKLYADDDCFGGFFTEEGNLELGEFLLAEDLEPDPEDSVADAEQYLWREALFAAQVTDVIRRCTTRALQRVCGQTGCSHESECPLKKSEEHSLANLYKAYRSYGNKCKNINSYATAAAIVELCASGKVKHVITYNFDTIIEEMLYDAINDELCTESGISQIHIWTFGGAQQGCTSVLKSADCEVLFHQGMGMNRPEDLVEPSAVHFFHVHGVAPGPSLSKGMEGYSGRLVFSQHSYEVYQDSTLNWSNQVLQYMFSQYNVLAIGFSGTDDNYRSFALEHIKASMEGFLVSKRDSRHRVVFLKARQPYREAIESTLTKAQKKARGLESDEELGSETKAEVQSQAAGLLPYCIDMVTNYYESHYKVKIKWKDGYVDVASELHEIATHG